MAVVEQSIPIGLALLTFLPAYIGRQLDDPKNVGKQIAGYAFYALSLFLCLMDIQFYHLVLEDVYVPTATETKILTLLTTYQIPFQTYLVLFGMLLALGIIVWIIRYIQGRKIERQETT